MSSFLFLLLTIHSNHRLSEKNQKCTLSVIAYIIYDNIIDNSNIARTFFWKGKTYTIIVKNSIIMGQYVRLRVVVTAFIFIADSLRRHLSF